MSVILNINYMYLRRSKQYRDIAFYFLKKIKPENKEKIRVNFLINNKGDRKEWTDLKEELEEAGIEAHVSDEIPYNIDNYMTKIRWSAEQDVSYSAKMDEDIFISNHVWDFLIANLHVLDDPKVGLFSVQLSNGIPSCEYIIEDFFDEVDTFKIRTLFRGKKFGQQWNRDYSSLNMHTINSADPWDYEAFFESLRNLKDSNDRWPIYYKGIHPIRVYPPCNDFMNKFILAHMQYITEPQDFGLRYTKPPYFCNSFFVVKTKRWRDEVIKDESLFLGNGSNDPWAKKFDEVALSQYLERNDLFAVFIQNSFCIHTMYKILKQSDQEKVLVDGFTKYLFGN